MKQRLFVQNLYFAKMGLLPVLVFGVLSGALNAARAERIFVNASNTQIIQDGTSWARAFSSLQAALNKAAITAGPDSIWVATGVYVPSQIYSPSGVVGGASGLNTPFLMTFNLPDRVAIFGGFVGTEKELEKRNPEANPTTLSGAFSGGEVWHVVTLGNDIAKTGVRAKLDGLIISSGDANGPSGGNILFAPFVFDHSLGGGVYVTYDSHLDVNNVTFENNSANVTGGGLNGDGGALGSVNSNVFVKCSRFNNNSSFLEGGAVEIFSQMETAPHKTIIEDSSFTNNKTGLFGGALVGEGILPNENSFVEIKHCSFINNTAFEGGAIVFDSIKSFVKSSRFVGNIGFVSAGALATTNAVDTIVNAQLFGPNHVFTKFSTTVSDSIFIDNVAIGDKAKHDTMFGGPVISGIDFPLGGGALVSYINGLLIVNDSKFIGNRAVNGPGGAILNGNSSGKNIIGTGAVAFEASTTVSNSTFIRNSAEQSSNVSPNILGNGGAIASEPGTFFNIPQLTIESIRLSVKDSDFIKNRAAGNGGAIYLNSTFARLKHNRFKLNVAALLGNNTFAVNSIINGEPTGFMSRLNH